MQLIIIFWKTLCSFPRKQHPVIAILLGKILYFIAVKRRKIANANIQLCFPNSPSKEKLRLLKDNFYFLGSSVFDTGIAWFWSDERIQKSLSYKIKGLDNLKLNQGEVGNLILFKHSQHLELDARILALNVPIYGVERSHNSNFMNNLQTKGRLSSMKETADKNNPRSFIKWLKEGKNVLYAIDQDYGWENSIKLKFFNQDVATITTTSKIIDITKCNLLFINSYYRSKKLLLELELTNVKGLNSKELAQMINNLMEDKILKHPAEYLWAHRRFKSTLGKGFYI